MNTFLNDLGSLHGSHVVEKMNNFLNKKIGNYALNDYRYHPNGSKLELDLSGSDGNSFRFIGTVDGRMFANSDFVLNNYLSLRIDNALRSSA